MTALVLKIIALISMFCDHVGYVIIGHTSFFNFIGRIAFPIFAFQISEGYIHTKNIKKYIIRLGIFAIISQIPFTLFTHKYINPNSTTLNVFFTLFLGLIAIYLYDWTIKTLSNNKKDEKNTKKALPLIITQIIGIIFVLLIGFIAKELNTDYGMWGVVVIAAFYIFKKNQALTVIAFILLCVIKYSIRIIENGYNITTIMLCIFTMISIMAISLYNGKQGKKIKYVVYLFYPLHLLLLYFIP